MSIISSKYLLDDATACGYAVPAFNIYNAETIQAVLEVCHQMASPVILAGTPATFNYIDIKQIYALCVSYANKFNMPLVLHLDHHESLADIVSKVSTGVRSAMIDGRHLPFEQHIELVRNVAMLCHREDCSVEAELGLPGGMADEGGMADDMTASQNGFFTDPQQAQNFVGRTGIDSLAMAVGTAHGLAIHPPKIDFQLLADIRKIVDVPLVLHGASDLPDDDVRRTIEFGICKVNISSALKTAFAGAVQQWFLENPNGNNLREYMGKGMDAIKQLVRNKIDICGSAGRL